MITGVSGSSSLGVSDELELRALDKENAQGNSSAKESNQATTGADSIEFSQESKEVYANYAILSSSLKREDKLC